MHDERKEDTEMSNKKAQIVYNPQYSFWIKKAVQELDDRDPVDALRDVEILKSFLEEKLADIQAQFTMK